MVLLSRSGLERERERDDQQSRLANISTHKNKIKKLIGIVYMLCVHGYINNV